MRGIGFVFMRSREAGRREVIETIETVKGNLSHAAFLLGICRRYLYKIIDREDLWDEVDRIRQQRQQRREEPEWLRRSREELRS